MGSRGLRSIQTVHDMTTISLKNILKVINYDQQLWKKCMTIRQKNTLELVENLRLHLNKRNYHARLVKSSSLNPTKNSSKQKT